ncbi:hypothetical protein [Serratia marcescens]|uniref:hypothetical protein n=1 Tax=Serratia marcescens TaxID=615 RepID=UPI0012B2F5D1|nr:hypothetical protein [Serratia marcescens]
MAHYNNKHIVDADIARSAGGSEHPVSKSSRELLSDIKSGENEVYFCQKLLQEWRKHNSLLARTWLASMISSKKAILTKENLSSLHEEIEKLIHEEKTKEIAKKDAHLVESAQKNGCIIFSNDNNARVAFSKIKEKITSIRGVIWLCPLERIEEIKRDVLTKKIISKENYL